MLSLSRARRALRTFPRLPALPAYQPVSWAIRLCSSYTVDDDVPDGVTVVNTLAAARNAAAQLMSAPAGVFHAADTEVADIDVAVESPVGHGRVVVLTVYSGPDVDFGNGPKLWIDTAAHPDILPQFKPWLESPQHLKVWHNYSFDKHVLGNHGIQVKGLGGDTMHMARLWSTARAKKGGYSLEGLSADILKARKMPMKERFAVPKLKKDGTPGKTTLLPSVAEIHGACMHAAAGAIPAGLHCLGSPCCLPPPPTEDPKWRHAWLDYCTYDTEATWKLRAELQKRLALKQWSGSLSLWDFYQRYYAPFAEVLADMEAQGIGVDVRKHLPAAEAQARRERDEAEAEFLAWASQYCADAPRMNAGSSAQVAQFLFSPVQKQAGARADPGAGAAPFRIPRKQGAPASELPFPHLNEALQRVNARKAAGEPEDVLHLATDDDGPVVMYTDDSEAVSSSDSSDDDGEALDVVMRGGAATVDSAFVSPAACASSDDEPIVGVQVPQGASEWPRARLFKVDNIEGLIEPGRSAPKKTRDIAIVGMGMKPLALTAGGWPAVNAAVLRQLAGDPHASPPKWGPAYAHFGGGPDGEAACKAIDALARVGVIDSMLSNFICPLQAMADDQGRVHCSLNLNTETGRLSARRPNLQNQPALDKDRYKVRAAFQADPGNTLIVADYGQLELRLLAHITKCKSMIDAFASGGDFHSRTAMGMYSHVAEAVNSGKVLLEWDEEAGAAPAPLVKDVFASERRRAKVLNFSIAYGKTARGLAADWNVSLAEAQETLDAWFADRPEVRAWQEQVKEVARREGATRTLMGRYRQLPGIRSRVRSARNHAERAAINTPLQGGAADVAMMAMLKLARNEVLAKAGWRMLLQIHDEVILEGPEASVDEAMQQVVADMSHPFSAPLLVDLVVDANAAKSWYDAK